MNFNVKISSKVNENEWNDNLAKSNASTIYQSYNWQKLYREVFGSKPIFISITNKNGIVVGQLACLIHEKMLWEGTNPISKKIGNTLKLSTSLWWYQEFTSLRAGFLSGRTGTERSARNAVPTTAAASPIRISTSMVPRFTVEFYSS